MAQPDGSRTVSEREREINMYIYIYMICPVVVRAPSESRNFQEGPVKK